MAPITPYQPGVVGAFQTQSKEFSGLRPYSPLGKLFEGVGDALSTGLRGWDEIQEQTTKNTQSDDIRGAVERDTQAGIDLLSPTGGRTASSTTSGYPPTGPLESSPAPFRMPPSMAPEAPVPFTTAPSVSVTGEAPIPQALGYASDPSAIVPVAGVPQDITSPAAIAGPEPVEITRGMERLDKLGRAIRLTHNIGLYADVLQQTKDLIAKYPNRRTQIIEQSKSILGTDAGMGLRNAVLQLLTIQANEANSNEKAWNSYLNSHAKYFVTADGKFNEEQYQKALKAANNPQAQDEVRTYISRVQATEHGDDVAKKSYERLISSQKASNVDGLRYAHERYSNLMARMMTGATFTLGDQSFTPESLLQIAKSLQSSGQPVDKQKLAQLGLAAGQVIESFEQQADAIDNELIGSDRKSLRSRTDPKELREVRDQHMRMFTAVRDQFGKENAVLATNMMNTLSGVKEYQTLRALAHPTIQQWSAIASTLPGEAAAVLINRLMMDNDWAGLNQVTRDFKTMQMLQVPARPIDQPAPSMRDWTQQFNLNNPTMPGPADPNTEIQRVTSINMDIAHVKAGISATNTPDVATRVKYAEIINHPDTGKWITDFKKDQQHIVWGRLADPEVSASMHEIGGQTWTNYKNWNATTLKQLYDTNIAELASAAKDPRLNLRLNEEGTQLVYDIPYQFLPPTRTLQRGANVQLPGAERDLQAVERFNTGLQIYSNILALDGEKITPERLQRLGLPLKGVQTSEEGGKPTYVLAPERDPDQPIPVQTTSYKKPVPTGANPPPAWLGDVSAEAFVPGGIQQAPGMEAPAQQAITQAISGTARFQGPSSPAIQAAVDTVVKGTGRSPAFIAAMASIESDMGRKKDRRGGTYRGLFQQGGENVREGENPDDPMSNAAITIRTTNQNVQILRNALGREPEDHEVYLAHQQGPGGGPALIRGAEEGLTAVESLRKYANLSAIRAIEHLRNNRRNDIIDVPIQNLSAAAFVESWRNAVEERKRAFGGGRQSALPFADEGRVVSDATDPLLAGEQYAMGLGGRNIYEAGARPGRPSGEGGGGGVAPSRGQQVGGNVREGLEVIEGEQYVPAPPLTRGRPYATSVNVGKRPTDEPTTTTRSAGDEVFEIGGQIVRRRSIPADVNQSVNAAMRAIREGQVEETVAQTGAELRGDIATRRAREAADLDAAVARRTRQPTASEAAEQQMPTFTAAERRQIDRIEQHANRQNRPLSPDEEAAIEDIVANAGVRIAETGVRRTAEQLTPRQQRARQLDSEAWERVFGDQYVSGQAVSRSDARRANREQMRRVREEDAQLAQGWRADEQVQREFQSSIQSQGLSAAIRNLEQRPFTEEDFARAGVPYVGPGGAASAAEFNRSERALRAQGEWAQSQTQRQAKFKDIRPNPEKSLHDKIEVLEGYGSKEDFSVIFKPKNGKEVEMIGYWKNDGKTFHVASMYGTTQSANWSIDGLAGYEFLKTLKGAYPKLEIIEGYRATGLRGTWGTGGTTSTGEKKTSLQKIRVNHILDMGPDFIEAAAKAKAQQPKTKGSPPQTKGAPGGYQAKDPVEGAAIKLKDGTIIEGSKGESHYNLVQRLSEGQLDGAVDGFYTSSGRFVDRAQAMKIVDALKQPLRAAPTYQLGKRAGTKRDVLFSEDLVRNRKK